MPAANQRRSRTDKLKAILKDYLPAREAPPVPGLTQFQSGFYEELMVCKGPFCQTIHRFHTNGDELVPRAQAIGYMYKMHGGAPIFQDDTILQKLQEIFRSVGLSIAMKGSSQSGQQAFSRQSSITGREQGND